MLKQTEFFAIRQAYEEVYRQCIVKYFAFSKGNPEERDFFSSLVQFCEKVMRQVRNINHQQFSKNKTLGYATAIYGKKNTVQEIEKFQQKFSECLDIVSKRKKMFDRAYLFGYSNESSLYNGNAKCFWDEKKQTDKCFLSVQDAISFFEEIVVILKKDNTYAGIFDEIMQLFQKYHISFIKS